MIYHTHKSKVLAEMLFTMKSLNYNLGIIGSYYYGIGLKGIVHRFKLRPNWQTDNYFPGIRSTKTRIGAKAVFELLCQNRKY